MTMIGKLMLGVVAAGFLASVGLAIRASEGAPPPAQPPMQLQVDATPPQIVETVAKPPPPPVDDGDDDGPRGS